MKAVALLSGGLDSSLAIKAVQVQGIEVIAVHCVIPFLKYEQDGAGESAAARIAERLGCKLRVLDISQEFLQILQNPAHGYGKNLNPCIDCKILMLKKAKDLMQREGAQFVVTGEVLNQRPMSQHLGSLEEIARQSGLAELLVRPLSAQCLPEVIPLKKKWLNKEKLFCIQGRGRRTQIALAEKWGIEDYPWPGGGCLLTDASFCQRVADLMAYDALTAENVKICKRGRFFRISSSFFLVVGRDEAGNEMLERCVQPQDTLFYPSVVPGPTAVGRGTPGEGDIARCAKIVARYTARGIKVEIKVNAGGKEEILSLEELPPAQLQELIR